MVSMPNNEYSWLASLSLIPKIQPTSEYSCPLSINGNRGKHEGYLILQKLTVSPSSCRLIGATNYPLHFLFKLISGSWSLWTSYPHWKPVAQIPLTNLQLLNSCPYSLLTWNQASRMLQRSQKQLLGILWILPWGKNEFPIAKSDDVVRLTARWKGSLNSISITGQGKWGCCMIRGLQIRERWGKHIR